MLEKKYSVERNKVRKEKNKTILECKPIPHKVDGKEVGELFREVAELRRKDDLTREDIARLDKVRELNRNRERHLHSNIIFEGDKDTSNMVVRGQNSAIRALVENPSDTIWVDGAENIPAIVEFRKTYDKIYKLSGEYENPVIEGEVTDFEVIDGKTYVSVSGFSGLLTETEEEYFTYTIEDEKVTITDYDTDGGLDVVIPEELGGYPVRYIGWLSFRNLGLDSVVLPRTVWEIGSEALYNNNLTEIIIPASVEDTGTWVFIGNDLEKVVILSNNLEIMRFLIFEDNNLTTVTIPDSVEEIQNRAFQDNDITNMILPSNVDIGDNAKSLGNLGLRDYYVNEGSQAGCYYYDGSEWSNLGLRPYIETISAIIDSEGDSVEVNVDITDLGYRDDVDLKIEYERKWGEIGVTDSEKIAETGIYKVDITGLLNGDYLIRPYLEFDGFKVYGDEVEVEVDVEHPSVSTEKAVVKEEVIKFKGDVDLGDFGNVEGYFQYREVGEEWENTSPETITEGGIFEEGVSLDNFQKGLNYEYRAVMEYEWEGEVFTEYGEIKEVYIPINPIIPIKLTGKMDIEKRVTGKFN